MTEPQRRRGPPQLAWLPESLSATACENIDSGNLWAVCTSSSKAIVADDLHLALLDLDRTGNPRARAVDISHLLTVELRSAGSAFLLRAVLDDETTFDVDLAATETEEAMQTATVLTLLSQHAQHHRVGPGPV